VAASQVYKGTWDASTNTPTLADGTGTAGWYYRVTVAGSVDFDGAGGRAAVTFYIGDDVSYNGTIWQQIPSALINGLALTKTDDTNVTLTLGGSPATSLLAATSMTLGWTGLLPSSRGGTGNGFTKFAGPTTPEKIFTLPDASATILTTNNFVTVAQGGTGVATTDANKVFAGPATGTAAAPTFRALVSADIPANAANTTGNASTVTTNANLTGPITSVGNATSVAAQTGTGTTFVMNTSPTLVTPALGTPSALIGTNITGTANGLTAGSVTNATLTTPIVVNTGSVTLTGNVANTSVLTLGAGASSVSGTNTGDQDLTGLVHTNRTALDLVSGTNTGDQTTVTGSAGSFTGNLGGDVTGTQSATVVGKINNVALSGLATGILKNTTTTGVPSIAVAGTDYLSPAGNESVTGTKTFDKDRVVMTGTSTGVTVLSTANTSANNYTITMPATTGTLVTLAGTETLTNKTLTSPTINSPTLITPALGTPVTGNFSTGTFTWPTFNQTTSGNAANVTGIVAIANGGTGSSTAPTARTALGGTTVGQAMFTLTNPSAITFPRFNADNTVTALSAADFRTAIGAGTSSATGTVTSVAALTLGTTGTDLSSSVATGTTTPVITLNVPTASAANRGALSAANWTTFNDKQAALVSGTNIKTVNGTTLLGAGDLGIISGQYGGTGISNTGKTITLGGSLTMSGAFASTLTVTAATAVTLPISGTLSTLAGAETLTNKTLTTPVISSISNTGTITVPTTTGTLALVSQITGTNSGTNTGDITFITESFSEFATGVTGQNNTLAFAPKTVTGVVVEMNGHQLIYSSQFTVNIATKIVQVIIPVYQYDALRITYTY
jgi:hypothetical protein